MDIIRKFGGYCCPWNTPTEYSQYNHQLTGRDTRDSFLPGCFDETLNSANEVLLLQDLDESKIAARRSDGSLRLEQDAGGLIAHVILYDSPLNRSINHRFNQGTVSGWSFRTAPLGTHRSWRNGDTYFRELIRGKLVAVAIVVNKIPLIRSSPLPRFLYGGPSSDDYFLKQCERVKQCVPHAE